MDIRKQEILEATIETYIETAQPVGSRYLTENKKFNIGSATIRHELNELVNDGYLTQRHSSSGRIPTDKGYRVYVDSLMKYKEPTEEQKRRVLTQVNVIGQNVHDSLRQISYILSSMFDYTTIVFKKDIYQETLKVAHLILMDINKVLVVLLDSLGINKEFLLRIEHKVTQEELNKISKLVTEKLGGKSLELFDKELIAELITELPQFKGILVELCKEISRLQTLNKNKGRQILTTGLSNMLKLPEFKNIELTQKVIYLLEENKALLGILSEYMSDKGCNVLIGEETKVEGLEECSLILAQYKIEKTPVGTIGILGPKRMVYPSIVPMVKSISKMVDTCLNT
ncbi:MAG: heat-inducible transcription repressor HrcA [bacterium]|nr:heat-inducible transcription repressor HrcA [bacterium]